MREFPDDTCFRTPFRDLLVSNLNWYLVNSKTEAYCQGLVSILTLADTTLHGELQRRKEFNAPGVGFQSPNSHTSSSSLPANEVTFHIPIASLDLPNLVAWHSSYHTLTILPTGNGSIRRWSPVVLFGLARPSTRNQGSTTNPPRDSREVAWFPFMLMFHASRYLNHF